MVYYNEIDPYAAEWLRNLIKAGHIASGEVDERSIQLVDSADLAGFTQCHFFAGVGVWSYALRLAGWPDDRPVWTGSCPCQPFSAAGKGAGFADERHLWPEFYRLINKRRPPVVFGEQVASKDGLEWLDFVQTDLERADYASAAVDICAAGVGAPHIRQRLYWVADAARSGHGEHQRNPGAMAGARNRDESKEPQLGRFAQAVGDCGEDGRVADAQHDDGRADKQGRVSDGRYSASKKQSATSPTNGHWRDADWLYCRDGKWRPVEPSTFPLAHGAASRVGRLRAYGNAIVPQVAQAFIEAFMECQP